MNPSEKTAKNSALAAYLSLLLLVMLWEGWLAPAPNAPPGIWLTLKSIPLLFPIRGLMRGNTRTYLLTTLLLLFYFTDGIVLTYLHWQDGLDLRQPLFYAILEWVLASTCFALALRYIKIVGQSART